MGKKQKETADPAELFTPLFGNPDKTTFRMQEGNKVYEVTTYFNAEGKQSVLQQFKDLILSEKLIENRTFDRSDEVL